jgi:hypothetical protein
MAEIFHHSGTILNKNLHPLLRAFSAIGNRIILQENLAVNYPALCSIRAPK